MLVLDTCGYSQRSQDARLLLQSWTGNRSTTLWGDGAPVIMAGGQYRLCWCGAVGTGEDTNFTNSSTPLQCAAASQMVVDAGEMVVVGVTPMHLQHRTCAVGLACSIGIEGLHLSNEDQVMVLATCGTEALVDGFPHFEARTTEGWLSIGWGPVSAQAGQYRLCWCSGLEMWPLPNASSVSCSLLTSFQIDVGELTLTGPAPLEQDRTCVSGHTCAFHSISGIGFRGDEQFLVLDTCGINNYVHGFPGAGFAENWTVDGRLEWGAEIVTSSGGNYRLCACMKGTADCNFAQEYDLDIGALSLIGPEHFQDRTCISGQACELSAIYGHYLSEEDSVVVLDTCGTHALPERFPMEASVTVSGESLLSIHWQGVPVTSLGGQYRLCWCHRQQNSTVAVEAADAQPPCTTLQDFRVDFGQLSLIGPSSSQQDRTCVSGQSCIFDAPAGHYLSTSDAFRVLATCGIEDFVPGFPDSHLQMVLDRGGTSLSWGSEFVTAYGGQYRICWCSERYACSSSEQFGLDTGELLLIGPRPLVQQRTCETFPCTVSGFSGLHLSSADSIMVLDTCSQATASQDASVGFLAMALSVASSGRGTAPLEGSVTIHHQVVGGTYRLCWCAGTYTCSFFEDFRVDVGSVSFVGLTESLQHRTCVSGQTCSWSGLDLWLESPDGSDGRLIVLDTCGTGAGRAPLPNGAVVPEWGLESTIDAWAGTERMTMWASWGNQRLSGAAGQYRACWCDWDCPDGDGGLMLDLASITILGPDPLWQHRTHHSWILTVSLSSRLFLGS